MVGRHRSCINRKCRMGGAYLMATIDGRARRVDIIDEATDTVTITGPVTNEDGTPYVWAGSTVAAFITASKRPSAPHLATFTPDVSVNGTITLTLPALSLGPGKRLWWLRITKAGIVDTWMSGVLILVAAA